MIEVDAFTEYRIESVLKKANPKQTKGSTGTMVTLAQEVRFLDTRNGCDALLLIDIWSEKNDPMP